MPNSIFYKSLLCFKKHNYEIKILNNDATLTYKLDIKNIKILMCDKNFKIIFSTLLEYEIGYNLENIYPKNINLLFKEWHEKCQIENIEITKNISINSKKYFILILPIIQDGIIIGSSMKIFDLIKK